MGMLNYQIIRMKDTDQKTIDELKVKWQQLNAELKNKISTIKNQEKTREADVIKLVQETTKLSSDESTPKDLLSLKRRLGEELIKLRNELKELYNATKDYNKASIFVLALNLSDDKIYELNQKLISETNHEQRDKLQVELRSKQEEREALIQKSGIENCDEFVDKSKAITALIALLEDARETINFFKEKNDPNFYALHDYHNLIENSFCFIYVNKELYKVTAKRNEDNPFNVEKITPNPLNQMSFRSLSTSLENMPQNSIKFANIQETFALTDVDPSSSEVLKTRNIVSVIVDFVHQFKIYLLNTFYPELSFETIERQCEVILAHSKFADSLVEPETAPPEEDDINSGPADGMKF